MCKVSFSIEGEILLRVKCSLHALKIILLVLDVVIRCFPFLRIRY
jgi:hypothetical protein